MANNYHNAHAVDKSNPVVNGPYLDDIRADQERAYREFRQATPPVAEDKVEVEEDVTVNVLDAQPELDFDD